MVRILLAGALGKMGRVVSQCVSEREDCQIAAGIDIVGSAEDLPFPLYRSIGECPLEGDVIVDFSHPSLLGEILRFAREKKVPAVICTTGLSPEQVSEIKESAKEVPIFFSANMSLGINLLSALAQKAAQVLGGQFDIEILEKHHNQKVDAPSGTALMLADAINEVADGRYEYVYDRHSVRRKRGKEELGIHSVRGGTIVGEHEVIFAGRDEVLTLSHSATSKEVFAVGAVNAAVFLAGQKPGLYDMASLL
ncbi:4-hydroxy-tetrahydrodipicolinate reductase [bacterium 210820-DFI.6.52]|nr:4-hydroxy-tetrahydrodipicolinate reductase [bacterium 210820-DFI.6.52]